MPDLVVAEVGIRTDASGRYCLNDLHRASGGEKKNGPSYWLGNVQTRALIAELQTTGIPVVAAIEGVGGGTYVAKELIYAYAMWISPSFHLKVIRAYDAMATGAVEINPASLSRLQLLQMAMQAEQERIALSERVEQLEPKARALERIADSDGSFCLTDAAKAVQMEPRRFTAWLSELGWIHRRSGGSGGWLAYQVKIGAGYLRHKVATGQMSNGSEWTSSQVRVTPKGMTRLAELYEARIRGVLAQVA